MGAGEIIAIIAGVTSFLTALGAFINSYIQGQKTARQDEFARLANLVDQLQEENHRLAGRINYLQEQLERRDQRIRELQVEVDQLRAELDRYRGRRGKSA